MSSSVRLTGDLLRFKPVSANEESRTEAPVSADRIRLLQILVVELQQQLELLSELQPPSVEQGLNFYDEVSRFEIDLIRRALILKGGHQGRAARLLNLKAKTLHAKITHYGINLNGLAGKTKLES